MEAIEASQANYPAIEKGTTAEKPAVFIGDAKVLENDSNSEITVGPNGQPYPSVEELATLERIRGKIDWTIYSIAFVELCERFAYYGESDGFDNVKRYKGFAD